LRSGLQPAVIVWVPETPQTSCDSEDVDEPAEAVVSFDLVD
jgi:hypothetical protein